MSNANALDRLETVTYVDGNSINAMGRFASALSEKINTHLQNRHPHLWTAEQDIIVLCIGTDRATGDCLGPITGHKLNSFKALLNKIHIYGCLEEPVHAKNLAETMDEIYASHQNPFIIAVDACLGRYDHVGFVTVGDGPVKPGAGVNKELPAVGDVAITGIVNSGGFMETMVIQNTRLSIVMKMADIITFGIVSALKPFC